ncbi:hypothetical protein GPALN_001798 [Globodera pallida]|nr:hypothetical protein GPALN_001798 [Globodera pallida]
MASQMEIDEIKQAIIDVSEAIDRKKKFASSIKVASNQVAHEWTAALNLEKELKEAQQLAYEDKFEKAKKMLQGIKAKLRAGKRNYLDATCLEHEEVVIKKDIIDKILGEHNHDLDKLFVDTCARCIEEKKFGAVNCEQRKLEKAIGSLYEDHRRFQEAKVHCERFRERAQVLIRQEKRIKEKCLSEKRKAEVKQTELDVLKKRNKQLQSEIYKETQTNRQMLRIKATRLAENYGRASPAHNNLTDMSPVRDNFNDIFTMTDAEWQIECSAVINRQQSEGTSNCNHDDMEEGEVCDNCSFSK